MKQLLLVNSVPMLNGGASNFKDLSQMAPGSIGICPLSGILWTNQPPTEDFAIAYARPNSQAIVIPEVDFHTLHVNIAEPTDGVAFVGEVTIPTVSDGSTYTLVLVKKGAVPHERNTWTATETVFVGDTTTNAAAVAAKLAAYFQNMADTGSLNVSAVASGAKITITGLNVGEQFTLKCADDLSGTAVTITEAEPAIGDKKYMQHLASECAAGKGFTDTDSYGVSIYPGYPEAIEDDPYTVITLRFAVGRKSAKTRDERVWQLVHIAAPAESSVMNTLREMFAPLTDGYVESEDDDDDDDNP